MPSNVSTTVPITNSKPLMHPSTVTPTSIYLSCSPMSDPMIREHDLYELEDDEIRETNELFALIAASILVSSTPTKETFHPLASPPPRLPGYSRSQMTPFSCTPPPPSAKGHSYSQYLPISPHETSSSPGSSRPSSRLSAFSSSTNTFSDIPSADSSGSDRSPSPGISISPPGEFTGTSPIALPSLLPPSTKRLLPHRQLPATPSRQVLSSPQRVLIRSAAPPLYFSTQGPLSPTAQPPPCNSRVVLDPSKSNATKYLYSGGVSTTLGGGVMLGLARPSPSRNAQSTCATAPSPSDTWTRHPAAYPKTQNHPLLGTPQVSSHAAASTSAKYRTPIGGKRMARSSNPVGAESWRRPASGTGRVQGSMRFA